MKTKNNPFNWPAFGILTGLGFIGVISMMARLGLEGDLIQKQLPPDMSLPVFLLFSTIQPSLLIALAVFGGLKLQKKTTFQSRIVRFFSKDESVTRQRAPFHRELLIASIIGISLGCILLVLDQLSLPLIAGGDSLEEYSKRTWLITLSGILYGGLTEELLMRFGLMSLFTWVLQKLIRKNSAPSDTIIWIANALTALLFGLGHLPILFQMVDVTAMLIVRTIALNMIGGLIFGYLFARRNLESAMIAHATTHIGMTLMYWLLAMEPVHA